VKCESEFNAKNILFVLSSGIKRTCRQEEHLSVGILVVLDSQIRNYYLKGTLHYTLISIFITLVTV